MRYEYSHTYKYAKSSYQKGKSAKDEPKKKEHGRGQQLSQKDRGCSEVSWEKNMDLRRVNNTETKGKFTPS